METSMDNQKRKFCFLSISMQLIYINQLEENIGVISKQCPVYNKMFSQGHRMTQVP